MCLDMAKNGVFLRLERSEGIVDDLSSRSGDSEKVHVLAVDDSLVDRKVIEGLLKITSFKVTAVESGWRALQFLGLDGDENSVGLDRLKVDMIITDYCMPGMTGYELLKKIKGSSAFRKVPVVIMSSENVLARIHRCLEEGAEDFIVKPVKLSDIKRLKRAVFGSSPNDDDNNNKDTAIVIQTKPDNNSNPGLPRRLPPWQEPPPPLPSPDNTPSSSSLNSPQSDSSSSLSPTSPHSPLALLLKDKDPSKDHPHDSTLLKEPHSPLEIILLTDPPHSSSPLKILLKEEEEGNDRKPPKDPPQDKVGVDRNAPGDSTLPN